MYSHLVCPVRHLPDQCFAVFLIVFLSLFSEKVTCFLKKNVFFIFFVFFLVVTRPPPVVTRQTRKPWQRPNPDRWPTTTNWNNMVTFPPTPMMPTIAPKYPSGPWQNNRNRFPIRTTPSTTMSTTTTTTTTTLPPSKI